MKKGFTLIELVAVIILLGLLGLIIYPTVNGVISNNKQKLHDKQIEELKRYAGSYIASNMSKLKVWDGAKNILTVDDLYDAGIIQNETIIDPLTEEEMTGCLSLIWNQSIKQFDINYVENCAKNVNLSGTITSSNSPIEAKVQLIENNKIAYETTTDASGNYNFNSVDVGRYILLASQPHKTRYGKEIELDSDTTENMDVTFYVGDINDDGVVNYVDRAIFGACYAIGCTPRELYDLDNDSYITIADLGLAERYKITNITFINQGNYRVSGKITADIIKASKVTLGDGTNTYTANVNADGTFSFENIPSGAYYIVSRTNGYTPFYQYIFVNKDIDDIEGHLYCGDVMANGIIDQNDIEMVIYAIEWSEEDEDADVAEYDVNRDGVVNDKDLELVKKNMLIQQEAQKREVQLLP